MKKIVSAALAAIISAVAFSQQPFSVKIQREGSLAGAGSPVSVLYNGYEKGKLKGSSELTISEPLPADSIIELKFRLPMHRPTKFFLYPNSSLNYLVSAKVSFGGINLKDLSDYQAGGTAGRAEQQNVLPKGMSVNKKNLAISYVNEKTLKSDDIRKQWARQGGDMVGRSLSYLLTFAGMSVKTAGTTTKTVIAGGGWTYTQNHYKITIPEYKPGIATWNSLVYGMGASVNLHMSSVTIDPNPANLEMPIVGGSFVMMINGNFGYTFGLGKFKTETNYKGLALELTYKPSIIASAYEGGSSTQLNFKGIGIDITRNSFSAYANRIAPKAKSKFSFLLLPPIKDTPFMVSFGYGLVWYR